MKGWYWACWSVTRLHPNNILRITCDIKVRKTLIKLTYIHKNMKINKIPQWFIWGISIFPLLLILGPILNIISFGKINFLFWMIIPSIIFEELTERNFYNLSNNTILNLIFILIFWFTIDSFLGILFQITKRILIIYKISLLNDTIL